VDVLTSPTRLAVAGALVALAALALLVAAGAVYVERHTPPRLLTEVYTPTFRHVPDNPPFGATLRDLRKDLLTPRGREVLRSVLPSEGGVLWLTLLLTFAIAFDF